MENDNLVFSFPLTYSGEEFKCVVAMQDRRYDISFNGRYMGSIALDGDMEWMQESGPILPQDIIDEIGRKVESKYM